MRIRGLFTFHGRFSLKPRVFLKFFIEITSILSRISDKNWPEQLFVRRSMSKGVEIFWSCGEDSDGPVSFVPGISAQDRQAKQNSKVPRTVATKSTKKHINPSQSPSKKNSMPSKSVDQKCKDSKKMSTKSHRASLKDLCAEDKERVANLIRELSKTSEEKEASQQQLGQAKKIFSTKLKEIKAENAKLEKEQQLLIAQYQDCQKLLAFYQSKLSEQQKEVSNDINKLLTKAEKAVTPNEKNSPESRKQSPRRSGNHRNTSHDDGIENAPICEDVLGESYCETIDPQPLPNDARRSLTRKPKYKMAAVQTSSPDHKTFSDESEIPRAYHGDSDEFARELLRNIRPEDQSSVATDTDERAREIVLDMGERVRSLSPAGRRSELLQQKEALEEEQFHLQKLLEEQEEQLRRRHLELRRRHADYMDRMRHFRYRGKFPSVNGDYPSSRDLSYDLNLGKDYDTEPIRGQGLVNSMRHVRRERPITDPMKSIGVYGMSDRDETSLTGSFHDRRSRSEPPSRYTSLSKSNPNATYHSYKTPLSPDERPFTTSQSDDVIDVLASSPRRPHNSTMNNLSELSRLVDDTEGMTSLSRDVTTAMRLSGSSDVMRKSTFDPEDSELLEDIFFIK